MTYIAPAPVVEDISCKDLAGTRVTLINMPVRKQARPNVVPLGLTLLGARLLAYGVEVALVDLNAYRIEDAESQRLGLPNGRTLTPGEAEALLARTFDKAGDQDLVALSGLITTLRWQEIAAGILRRLQPAALMVSGGGLATELRETLLDWIPELDGIAHSEGDDVVLKIALDARRLRERGLARTLGAGDLAPYLRGVRANGRPRLVYDGGRPKDLSALPLPAFDLLGEDVDGVPILETYIRTPIWGTGARNSSATSFDMRRSLSTVSSRGCPFECRFCFRGAQGERNYGVRSARNLAEELDHYARRYRVDFVGFVDDNFMVNPKRIADMVGPMAELASGGSLHWGTHGRLDEAADLRPKGQSGGWVRSERLRVDDMAAAGCIYIGFGAESASPAVLDAMGKGGFMLGAGTQDLHGYRVPRTMVEGIRNTRAAGIHPNCTWIMGYPGETLEDLKTSAAFIKWQKELGREAGESEDTVNSRFFTATAYPGTEMFTHPKVRSLLAETFGLSFEGTGQPVPDASLRAYILQLDDATKLLYSDDGRPINYGEMPDDLFVEARALLDQGELDKVLGL